MEVKVVALTVDTGEKDVFDIIWSLPTHLFEVLRNNTADLVILSLQNSKRNPILNFHSIDASNPDSKDRRDVLARTKYDQLIELRNNNLSLLVFQSKSFRRRIIDGFVRIIHNKPNKLIHRLNQRLPGLNNHPQINIDVIIDGKLSFNVTALDLRKTTQKENTMSDKYHTKISKNIPRILNSNFAVILCSVNSSLNVPQTLKNTQMLKNRTYTFLKMFDSFYSSTIKDKDYIKFKEPFLYPRDIYTTKGLKDLFYCTGKLKDYKCFTERVLFYLPAGLNNRLLSFLEYRTIEEPSLSSSHSVLKTTFKLTIPEINRKREILVVKLIVFGLKRFGKYSFFINTVFCKNVHITRTNQEIEMECRVMYVNNFRVLCIDMISGQQSNIVKRKRNIIQKLHVVLIAAEVINENSINVDGFDEKGEIVFKNWISIKTKSTF